VSYPSQLAPDVDPEDIRVENQRKTPIPEFPPFHHLTVPRKKFQSFEERYLTRLGRSQRVYGFSCFGAGILSSQKWTPIFLRWNHLALWARWSKSENAQV
jgi:hypothetical protein